MGVVATYLENGQIEYIGDTPYGTLWFHLEPKTGKSKFFDEQGKEIERPSWATPGKANLYRLVGLDETVTYSPAVFRHPQPGTPDQDPPLADLYGE